MTRARALTLRVVETVLTATAGAALGGALGLPGGMPAALALGGAAGLNGALGGWRRAYDWRAARGWLAFVADSTWGLLGTALGVVLHMINLIMRGAVYQEDLSRRRNRHWFQGGARLRRGFVLTLGNVVSDTPAGRPARTVEHQQAIDRHEQTHIRQNRMFGPVYPAGYAAWFLLGSMVGTAAWAIKGGRPGLFRLVETAAYYHNPFEYWAYRRDGRGVVPRADPLVRWPRPGRRRRAPRS